MTEKIVSKESVVPRQEVGAGGIGERVPKGKRLKRQLSLPRN